VIDGDTNISAPLSQTGPRTGFRWTICALVFFAMTVNYLDRQLFSILVPFFEDDLKLGPTDLALINVSFLVPYGVSMLFVGRAMDRVGVRRGLSGAFLVWNLASLAHAFVGSLAGFMGVRGLLGVAESGMYPVAIKAMADWFPQKERALAAGYINAGANFGAFLAPILGVWIAIHYGWRSCFEIVGAVGMVWIVFWRIIYREPEKHPKVSESELAYIRSDADDGLPQISYSQLFALPSVYGLAFAKALTDAPWWFYLTWMPKFLVDQFHLSPTFMIFSIPVIYVVADLGSIGGGWLSSKLISRGESVGTARKKAMFVCAVLVLPVMSVGFLVGQTNVLSLPPVYWAVAAVALAAGAHQGWSSNLFTLISDTVPPKSVAMAVGAINGFAMLGASAMQFFVGWSVQITSSYTLPFIVAGSLYLIALGVIQLFIPHVKQSSTTGRANLGWVSLGGIATLAALGVLLYVANKPPYSSLQAYRVERSKQLGATAGPDPEATAKVGWMNARWFVWRLPNGRMKADLVKFDSRGHPFIESKGADAPHYSGPPAPRLKS
jgi:ACS family hexuronate transporter-like MFS transporter